MEFEREIIGHVNLGMLMMFIFGLIALIGYSLKNHRDHIDGYSHKNYMRLTRENIFFHITMSFAVLMIMHELGEPIVNSILKNIIPGFEGFNSTVGKTFDWTFSFLAGALGSTLVAWVLEKARKRANTNDQNVEHKH